VQLNAWWVDPTREAALAGRRKAGAQP
jgi:hypothetical protein